jgi:hypothetical protein
MISIYRIYTNNAEINRSILQKILDSNLDDNKLNISYAEVPIIATLLFQSQYTGYFTVSGKNNNNISEGCTYMTIDYSARKIGGGRTSISVDAQNMFKLRRCN